MACMSSPSRCPLTRPTPPWAPTAIRSPCGSGRPTWRACGTCWAGLGRGHRREPAPRLGRPGHPAEHRDRRLPRPGLPGQPGRGRAGRRALRAVGGRAARPRRPGGYRRAGGGRARYRRGLRASGSQGPGRDRGGARRPGPRGTAGHLPPPWHADGRAGQLRRGQPQHRPGRDVRGRHPPAGRAGLALQSTGGTGFVLVEHLSRIGVGISSLVSFGDKDDVSGTDMLQWWESDEETKLALLYLESIGNPPKFARTARRVGRTMPVLTVAVGRSRRAGGWPGPRRKSGHPAGHPAGPVRAGRHHRRREPRRAARHRGAAGRPAGTRREQGRRGVQHPRRCGARRRRVRRRGPGGRRPRRPYPAGAAGHARP